MRVGPGEVWALDDAAEPRDLRVAHRGVLQLEPAPGVAAVSSEPAANQSQVIMLQITLKIILPNNILK